MPAAAQAQAPATSFAELASLLKTGETVSTNNAGKTVKGRVQQVSDTTLVLRSGQRDLPLAAPDVQRIARSRHTLRNGALIGLAAGFGAGGAWALSQPSEPRSAHRSAESTLCSNGQPPAAPRRRSRHCCREKARACWCRSGGEGGRPHVRHVRCTRPNIAYTRRRCANPEAPRVMRCR